jgi:porin
MRVGLKAWRFLIGLILILQVAPDLAKAQPYETPDTWGGDILARPRLTGDWGGSRDDLAKMGVVFDADLLLTPQDVVSGGRSTGANFWGNADYTLNLDTQKMGLWPGGFFKFEADTGFGSNVLKGSGAIVPVNTAALLPASNDRTTALTNATFMQFLSPQFGFFGGKINTFDLGKTEFYGDYATQFENGAFNFPITTNNVPLSSFGGGVIALPSEDIILSALALGTNGTPTSDSPSQAFSNGVTVIGSGQLTVKPFGLVGHQSVGFYWDDKDQFSLNQDPSNLARLLLNERFPRLASPGPFLSAILARFFPGLADPNATCQPQQQHLVDELCIRSISLAARRRPETRHRRILLVRGVRREPKPDTVCVHGGNWRQGRGPGPTGRQLRPWPCSNRVQWRLCSVSAPAVQSRPHSRGRGRDVL